MYVMLCEINQPCLVKEFLLEFGVLVFLWQKIFKVPSSASGPKHKASPILTERYLTCFYN